MDRWLLLFLFGCRQTAALRAWKSSQSGLRQKPCRRLLETLLSHPPPLSLPRWCCFSPTGAWRFSVLSHPYLSWPLRQGSKWSASGWCGSSSSEAHFVAACTQPFSLLWWQSLCSWPLWTTNARRKGCCKQLWEASSLWLCSHSSVPPRCREGCSWRLEAWRWDLDLRAESLSKHGFHQLKRGSLRR